MTIQFIHSECASCGIQFCLTSHYHANRVKDGRRVYCPNGCQITFNTSLQPKPLEPEKKCQVLNLVKKDADTSHENG